MVSAYQEYSSPITAEPYLNFNLFLSAALRTVAASIVIPSSSSMTAPVPAVSWPLVLPSHVSVGPAAQPCTPPAPMPPAPPPAYSLPVLALAYHCTVVPFVPYRYVPSQASVAPDSPPKKNF